MKHKITFISKADILSNAANPQVISDETYVTKPDGHKFRIGDTCRLKELESFPDFNGMPVTITNIRKDGKYGKAYYINWAHTNIFNWVYEYRLEILPPLIDADVALRMGSDGPVIPAPEGLICRKYGGSVIEKRPL